MACDVLPVAMFFFNTAGILIQFKIFLLFPIELNFPES